MSPYKSYHFVVQHRQLLLRSLKVRPRQLLLRKVHVSVSIRPLLRVAVDHYYFHFLKRKKKEMYWHVSQKVMKEGKFV